MCVLLTVMDHPVVVMTIVCPQSDNDYDDNDDNYVHVIVTIPHCALL